MRILFAGSAVLAIIAALGCIILAGYSDAHPFRVRIPGRLARHVIAVESGSIVLVRDGAWSGDGVSLRSTTRWLVLLSFACALPLLPNEIKAYRARRRFRGECLGCGYDLTGNTGGVCPECGKPRKRWQYPKHRRP